MSPRLRVEDARRRQVILGLKAFHRAKRPVNPCNKSEYGWPDPSWTSSWTSSGESFYFLARLWSIFSNSMLIALVEILTSQSDKTKEPASKSKLAPKIHSPAVF